MNNARAFTLVELMAATALAAILMLAVLQVTASLGRLQAAMTSADRTPPEVAPEVAPEAAPGAEFPGVLPGVGTPGGWREDVAAMVRRDLRSARHVQVNDHNLVIEGLCDVTPDRKSLAQMPTIVYYHLSDDGQGLLVRRQTTILGTGDSSRSYELVAMGVKAFDVKVLYRSPSGLTDDVHQVRTVPVAPARVQVRLAWMDAAQSPLAMTFGMNE